MMNFAGAPTLISHKNLIIDYIVYSYKKIYWELSFDLFFSYFFYKAFIGC